MTTENDLRDLLTEEAGVRATPGDWEHVVRRGRHRRRVDRARTGLVAGGLAALAALGVVTMTDLMDDEVDRSVVADGGERSSITTTTIDRSQPDLSRIPDLVHARATGNQVTLILGAADPSLGFDPCTEQSAEVTETAQAVTISIGKHFETGVVTWPACQSSPFSSRGTITLAEPLGARRLIEAGDGEEITVIDQDQLLFPATLPAPFDITRWDEFSDGRGWTFSWSAADMVLGLSTSPIETERPTACLGETVEVRGVSGNLCRDELSHELQWSDGSSFRAVSLTDVGGNPLPSGIDLVAIADSLQPMGPAPTRQ